MISFSLSTRGLTGDPKRQLSDQIDDAAELVRHAASLGTFGILRCPAHWISHPTVWAEPIPLLARLAPEAGDMRLLTSVVKPPILNPVDLAHQVATLDHICHGRFILGVGLGYHRGELEVAGTNRRERVARFEESLALMKALWTGEPVDFEGRFWSLHGGRMGYTPVQKPHPPIWNAAYSEPATLRAARICDGLYLADQLGWDAARDLAGVYRAECAVVGRPVGEIGINRNIAVADTFEEAAAAIRSREAAAAAYYASWGMREAGTGDILTAERDERSWTIVGTATDCVEQLQEIDASIGLDFIGLNFANMPSDLEARKDYLSGLSDDVLSKVGARAPEGTITAA